MVTSITQVSRLLLLTVALDPGETLFREEVAPLLERHCVRCHRGESPEGGLNLTTSGHLFSGGESGSPVVAGQSDESFLIDFVSGNAPEMPKEGDPLSTKEVQALRRWIDAGANWPKGRVLKPKRRPWWSLDPLVRPLVPAVNADDAAWVRTPVDAFILHQLRARGLSPATEADRRTLIRRLYFDLTGLPPTPREIEDFVHNSDPRAYEKLVDRLLGSPRYGERWARHWLDVVHFGESHGYDKDKPRNNAWPYRDYVIRSLNGGKPYGQFVQEQIAGDVLFPDSSDGFVAMGFLAAGPWDFIGHVEVAEAKIDGKIARHLDRDDMVQNTLTTFNSLTVGCAQCHDHKFDPITQDDYYSLQAVFAAVDRADRKYYPDRAMSDRYRLLELRRYDLRINTKKLRDRIKELGGKPLADLDQQIRDVKTADQKRAESKETATPNDQKDQQQDDQPTTASPDNQLDTLQQQRDALLTEKIDPEILGELEKVETTLADVEQEIAEMPTPSTVYTATVHYGEGNFHGTGPSGGKPRSVRLLIRGDVRNPGDEVVPGAMAWCEQLPARFGIPPDAPEGDRRAALARWLSDSANPLTWRSVVNRVWLYHFGRGLVNTPNDFGRMGEQPTHPRLLEWLAADLRDEGESLKRLHQLIVTSSVYRQSSAHLPSPLAVTEDPENRFYWRMNRRRLEAEAIRDTVLFASGKLDGSMGGPSFQDFVIEKPDHSPHYQYHLHDPEDPRSFRRSIYRFLVRSQSQPFMTVMDCADPSIMVARRNQTNSPLQALALLNNKFMLVMAKHFADRVSAAGVDLRESVADAFYTALGRRPAQEELDQLCQFAQRHGLANMCRALTNLNEFVFVD
jgi:hypothetical protein